MIPIAKLFKLVKSTTSLWWSKPLGKENYSTIIEINQVNISANLIQTKRKFKGKREGKSLVYSPMCDLSILL